MTGPHDRGDPENLPGGNDDDKLLDWREHLARQFDPHLSDCPGTPDLWDCPGGEG